MGLNFMPVEANKINPIHVADFVIKKGIIAIWPDSWANGSEFYGRYLIERSLMFHPAIVSNFYRVIWQNSGPDGSRIFVELGSIARRFVPRPRNI